MVTRCRAHARQRRKVSMIYDFHSTPSVNIHLNLKFAILLLTVRPIMVALKLPQEGPKILSHISYSAGFPDFYILYYMEHWIMAIQK